MGSWSRFWTQLPYALPSGWVLPWPLKCQRDLLPLTSQDSLCLNPFPSGGLVSPSRSFQEAVHMARLRLQSLPCSFPLNKALNFTRLRDEEKLQCTLRKLPECP